MRIVALVKRLDHVCCRYRLAAYASYWKDWGYRLELRTWPRPWLSRLLWRRELGKADVVILQRRLPPAWQLALLRRAAPRLVFDFDDAVFGNDSFAGQGPENPGRARRFAAVVRAADAVVAGNRFLRDQAELLTGPGRIHAIPTCLDPDRYHPAKHEGAAIRLAWIGSSSTLRSLAQGQPLLENLGRRFRNLELKIICDKFLDLNHLPVLRCPWSEETEAADLAGADIGISWLPEDDWSRGKCGLKILQYLAAGLPVVANPVGMQAELVRPGETGFLARTAEEWCDAVGRLATDPALRRRMGRAGRDFVRAHFHPTRGAVAWKSLLEQFGPKRKTDSPAATETP